MKFETNVSDMENKNEHTFGKISFEDENGIVDFTITLIQLGVVILRVGFGLKFNY